MDVIAADLVGITGCDMRTALYYIKLAGGDYQKAVGLYFELGGAPPPEEAVEQSTSSKFSLPSAETLPEIPVNSLNILSEAAKSLKVPRVGIDQVFKDECMYSFATPFAPDGLFTNLVTFESVSRAFVSQDSLRTGVKMYLLQRWSRPVGDTNNGENDSQISSPVPKKPKTVSEHFEKMAKEEEDREASIQKNMFLYVPQSSTLPEECIVPYPFKGISEHLYQVVESLLAFTDQGTKNNLKSSACTFSFQF